MKWTQSDVATLRQLWGEGLSASQISKQLRCFSRNAVIGKVHRLGMAGRARVAAANPNKVKGAKIARLRITMPKAEPLPPPSVNAPTTPLDPALNVLALRTFTCRFPLGDPKDEAFAFCGRESAPGGYCAEHHKLCYQPETARQKLICAAQPSSTRGSDA